MENITNYDLENHFNFWLDHYTKNGDKHYSDTPDWKIRELYFEIILDRVLNELPEMTDSENEEIINRINNL